METISDECAAILRSEFRKLAGDLPVEAYEQLAFMAWEAGEIEGASWEDMLAVAHEAAAGR